MEKTKKYSDLELVSYLMCKGFKEAERSIDDRRVFFHFKDSPELTQEVLNFYTDGHPQVDAHAFAYHLRRLRIIVNELPRGGGHNV